METGVLLKNSKVAYLLVAVFTSIFALGIGGVHLFDLDELYFAEITREMIHTGQYGRVTFGFEPLYEKPPLFFWLQAASMHLWGVNEIGARFPNLLCGSLTLVTLYYIGKRYKSSGFGCIWMCLYATAFLPHFYFKSAIIDPFFNYFLLLALYFLSNSATLSNKLFVEPSLCCGTCRRHGAENRSVLVVREDPGTGSTNKLPAELELCRKSNVGAGFSIGCALLLKGPMALVIPLATLFLSYTWFKGRLVHLRQVIVALLIAVSLFSCWLLGEIWSNGYTFIKEFWAYHLLLYKQPVYTHDQPWYYHFVVLFWGCFPSSLFAILFLKQKKLLQNHYFAANMQALLVIVLLIFTLVGTKIVHYSSMAYFPITFFAADCFYGWYYSKKYTHSGTAYLFLGLGLLLGSAMAMLPFVMRHKTLWLPMITNQAIKDALDTSVVWHYWDSMPGIIYMMGIGLAYYYLVRFRLVYFVSLFVWTNSVTLTWFLIHVAPKVEGYTQKEMVDFCKASKGKAIYLTTVGFKSAAPLFYADQPKSLQARGRNWLLKGAIDKPCFFIVYKSDRVLLADYQDIIYIKETGSFAFYKRLPSNQ